MTHSAHSRRNFLGAGALACTHWLSAVQKAGAKPDRANGPALSQRAKARRVIMIFHCGGPSHLDLWDPKPDAPAEIRGPFQTIATKIPGVRFSELLPRLAPLADQFAILRTVNHTHTQHNSAMCWSITGKPYRLDSTLINPGPTDFPSLGSVVGHLARRERSFAGSAPYVITPYPSCDSYAYLTPGQFGGFLGKLSDPFILNLDPSIPFAKNPFSQSAEIATASLQEKMALWGSLDRSHGEFARQKSDAAQFLGQSAIHQASRLDLEPDRVRESYGKHPWGNAHLLARRLLEAGSCFVSVVNGPSITWDTHKNNFETHKKRLVPPMEKAMAALVDDLIQRGLWEDTIVLSLADFGRTPKINADSGRDHWPQCFTALLGGGPIVAGAVHGASDRTGAYPKDFPVSPADIHATILEALGHAPEKLVFESGDGRPIAYTDGSPIRRILA